MSNCTKCHEIGKTVHNQKCLDCHKEINELIRQSRGYHFNTSVSNKDCSSCHSEHHGRNFRIINFDEKVFNHSLSGYDLSGKHKEIECEKCHQSNFINDPNLKKRANTFLGLNTSCNSCHEDFHQNTLSTKCENCHNTTTFRPAASFNHENSNFKLRGAHKNVECGSCHKTEARNGRDFQIFKGLKFALCSNCHQDIHNGKFSGDCEKCHSIESFKTAKNLHLFDHSKTGFSLLGKHLSVKCEKCHSGGFTKKIPHDACSDCHTDYHKGEFNNTLWGSSCEECHTVEGFRPSIFSIERHSKTDFPLIGSHLAYPCESCHLKSSEWKFKLDGLKCINCHETVHGNTINEKYLSNNNCEGCHNVISWSDITFSHSLTSFALQGVHGRTSCRKCHFIFDNADVINYNFHKLSTRCEDCHNDIHFGQFRTEDIANCERCHSFNNWDPDRFNHEMSRFKIDGAHKNVECAKCHKMKMSGDKNFTQYKFDNIKCASCHS